MKGIRPGQAGFAEEWDGGREFAARLPHERAQSATVLSDVWKKQYINTGRRCGSCPIKTGCYEYRNNQGADFGGKAPPEGR